MNLIGTDCEKIIWDYHFNSIRYDNRIDRILEMNDDVEFNYNINDNKQQCIYLSDFIQRFKKMKSHKKIYYARDDDKRVIKHDINLLDEELIQDRPIITILKLKKSCVFYILF
jgi:phosphoenolpyruvate synthase/pyruvate phosphate dikinase